MPVELAPTIERQIMGEQGYDDLPSMDPIERRAVCLDVTFRMPSFRKKVRRDKAEVKSRKRQTSLEDEEAKDPDQDRMTVYKATLEGNELKQIKKMETRVRAYLETKCVPCLIYKRGVVLLPYAILEEVYAQLRLMKRELLDMVATLAEVYDERKAEAKERLGDLYEEKDYPTREQLYDLFDIVWVPRARGVPQALREFKEEVFRAEQEKVQRLCQQEFEYVRSLLRVHLTEMVNHLAEAITPNPDGTKRVFKNSTVEKVKEFLDNFPARDITDDTALAGVVVQLREILDGVTPRELRNSNMAATIVRDRLREVQRTIAEQITTAERVYDWNA